MKQRLFYWQRIHEKAFYESPTELPENIDVLTAADQIWIWIGTSLDDQMTLAWLPAFLRGAGADPERVRSVQFHKNARGMEILSLGMLNPKQVAAHPPPSPITKADLATLDTVWRALTAPEPDELMAYLAGPDQRLPFLKRALQELPRRYPDRVRGVSAKQEGLLRSARLTPKASTFLAHVLNADYEAVERGTGGLDQAGSIWLYAQALGLADSRLGEPALQVSGPGPAYRGTELRLTAFGSLVLEGQANFVEANGIDDWVAGVHLESAQNRVWVHHDGKLMRR